MTDWLVTHLSERERMMYRIAMRFAKDPIEVDDLFFTNFVARASEWKKEEPIEKDSQGRAFLNDGD